MKRARLKLQSKIMLLFIIILFLSVFTIMIFISKWSIYNTRQKAETNVMNIAHIVANSPSIANALIQGDPEKIIQPYVKTALNSIKDIDIVVVADMNGIRYAHPNENRIGERFVGGDEKRVIDKGETYISEAKGTLGTSIRAFVPIHENGTQIGFVMAGSLVKGVIAEEKRAVMKVMYYALMGLLLGIIGALILAQNIKRSLFGLEPYQIAQLYTEKEGMLQAVHEGIIAIDTEQNVTMVNDSAIRILKIKYKNVIGRKVLEVFPTSRLPEVMEAGKSEFNREQIINDTVILTNRVPIIHEGKIIGAMATFSDKTKVTRLAEEITGVNQIVDALRANTHEFMNKLHVILGLIQIGELEQAKKYIINVREQQQLITSIVMNKIKDSMVAGLLLGKFSRAKELGIKLEIHEDTYLEKSLKIDSNTIVTIVGNFIENAMEAVVQDDKIEKKVIIRIQDYDDRLEIEVSDSGIGIEEENLNKIFIRGFSTKSKEGGIGLSLIKDKIDNLGGKIKVSSVAGKGTTILAIIPKEE
jgi:sensor histidine kinase regulating citrate/malate metabolism